jgi:hypothetical protein
MGRRWAFLAVFLGACACVGALAWGQATGVNPPVGSVWTYLGATYGAAWALPPLGVQGYVPNNASLGTFVTGAPQAYRAGFYAPGDGGGMVYTHSASPCSLAGGVGDNGSQVKAADGGCWLAALPASGSDPRVWGAKCDGATNDAPAIQAAIAAPVSQIVQLTYNCVLGAPITLKGQIKLVGQYSGRNAPATLLCHTGAADCITVPNSDSVTLRDLQVDASAMTGGNTLTLQSVSDFLADNVFIQNSWNGVNVIAGNNMIFSNSFINLARGQYGLKWDQASPTANGDLLNLTNTTIACGYNATPAATADGIYWDGNTKTLNLTNVVILRCNHGMQVANSRGQAAFPQFLFAQDLQIEGATSNAFLAKSGSSFWITNGYFDNARGGAQGSADGSVMVMQCDPVAGAYCGSAPAGASVNLWLTNAHIFDSGVSCVSFDWSLSLISNSTLELCSLAAPVNTQPKILFAAHTNQNTLTNSNLFDLSGNYAVQTVSGALDLILKDNFLVGTVAPVSLVNGSSDNVNKVVQWFLQIPAGNSSITSNVAPLKLVDVAVCTQGGSNAGGAYYTATTAPNTLTINQTTTAQQAYNCIVGGF